MKKYKTLPSLGRYQYNFKFQWQQDGGFVVSKFVGHALRRGPGLAEKIAAWGGHGARAPPN